MKEHSEMYNGYELQVHINEVLGFRCGYVVLKSRYKGQMEMKKYPVLSCHGGVTYYEKGLPDGTQNESWVIGFDCGHWGDGCMNPSMSWHYGHVWTKDEVIAECKHLIDQLIMRGEK